MRPLACLLLAVSALGFAQKTTPAAEADPVKLSVSALMDARDKHNNKAVEVTGVVIKFEARTSKRGNKYTVFKMEEGKDTVSVWLGGHLDPSPGNGDKVVVTGTYRKEKKVGQMTFKDEIDASTKKGKPSGVKILSKKKS